MTFAEAQAAKHAIAQRVQRDKKAIMYFVNIARRRVNLSDPKAGQKLAEIDRGAAKELAEIDDRARQEYDVVDTWRMVS